MTLMLGDGDEIEVHPAADLFPMMTDGELDQLAADIAKNGLQQPLVFLGKRLLDGRNRALAISRISDKRRRDEIAGEIRSGKKAIMYLTLHDPFSHVESANLHR